MKYIENPLLVRSRKTDMRCWIMVTDWKPLTTWIHKDCYFRLAYSDYDSESNDMKSHITNNKLQKKVMAEEDEDVSKNFLSRRDF